MEADKISLTETARVIAAVIEYAKLETGKEPFVGELPHLLEELELAIRRLRAVMVDP